MFVDEFFETVEVTPLTLAVIPYETKNGEIYSKILEDDTDIIIEYRPTEVINLACKYFATSLDGLQEGTRALLNLQHKIPVCIEAITGMYFFPTSSPNNPNCHWLAHTHIRNLIPTPSNQTEVHFHNGRKITVDASYGSMENQLHRTAQFRFLLDYRIQSILTELRHSSYRHSSSLQDLAFDRPFVAESPLKVDK